VAESKEEYVFFQKGQEAPMDRILSQVLDIADDE